MKTYSNRLELIKFLGDTLLVHNRRKPENAFDYGDHRTIGLHVKTLAKEQNGWPTCGIFIGRHDEKPAIVVFAENQVDFCRVEVFDNDDEMKSHWQLD